MKKNITLFGLSLLFVSAVALTAATQQDKNNKNDKSQQQGQGNSKQKQGKPSKDMDGKTGKNYNQPGNNDKNKQQESNNGKGNNGKNDNNGNNKKDDYNDGRGRNDNKNAGNNGKDYAQYGYTWNRENFKDRQKIKKQDKVEICHKFNGTSDPAVSIRVSANAVKAHMNHGDIMGNCPNETKGRYSDLFLRNRSDYYNNVQNTQEQVYYSRSILDYAIERLSGSRSQLAIMQSSNLPLADIQRKQATVVELEQNVSLLETVLGVAANFVVNKLQQ